MLLNIGKITQDMFLNRQNLPCKNCVSKALSLQRLLKTWIKNLLVYTYANILLELYIMLAK